MSRSLLVVLGVAALAAGCAPTFELPASFDVATTASEKTSASAGSGVPLLANSTWSLARVDNGSDSATAMSGDQPAGPYGGILNGDALERPPIGERIFLIELGAAGEMVRVTENRFFLAEIYGEEVPIDGEWAGTVLPGVSFRSATFGVGVGSRYGFAVVVHVRFGEIFLGSAVLYSWGTISDGALTGQLGYLLDFTRGAVPALGTIADQYAISGQRVAP
ncbi:MAG: hypothetical protein JNG88_01275 [Phycisphaerales bacterium]|nr:hypothetical protein [Phycisphaerales bacterium]